MSTRIACQCKQCSRSFTYWPSRPRIYCSRRCADQSKHSRLEDRFWSYVKQGSPNECWPWTGGTGRRGYGKFWMRGRSIPAHRVAYLLNKGSPGHYLSDYVCHSCDNPPCCNPAHLWAGTAQDNQDDSKTKGRTAKGDKNGARKHPDKWKRGDDHWTRRRPELLVTGNRHWCKHRPERFKLKPYRTGHTATVGDKNGRAKLTEANIPVIRARLARGERLTDIGRDFGVSYVQIARIRDGMTWTHV